MVGFDMRFSHQVIAFKNLINNHMGNIYNLSITYGGLRIANPNLLFEWRMDKHLSGYGALQDFGSHMLDFALYACNISIKEVSSMIQTHIPTRITQGKHIRSVENDDSCIITGIGEKGELCSFHMSRVGFNEFNVIVSGEGGLIKMSLSNNHIEFLPKQRDGGYQSKTQIIETKVQPSIHDFIQKQDQVFIEGLLGNEVDICTFEQACQTQKVLDEAEKSTEEKKTMYIDGEE
jgi:predicted dehydrogenase